MITISARGTYRDATAHLRAARHQTVDGRQYLTVNARQIRRAGDKCCYAGDDYLILAEVAGYSPWMPTEDGAVCYGPMSADHAP